MSGKLQRFLDRLESRIALWAVISGSSVVGVITGWLSRGVDVVNQFGFFGWWVAGLFGALIAALFLLALACMRYAWVHTRTRQKWADRVDDFNPLDKDFRNKRMLLQSIANPITKKVAGKRFYDCEIIGPANIFVYQDIYLNGVTFFDCSFFVLWPDATGQIFPGNSIVFQKVEMHGGTIYQANILIPPHLVRTFREMGIKFSTLTGDKEFDSELRPSTGA